MAKKLWSVYGIVTGTKYLGDFEAETEQEAIEMGLESEEAYVSLCSHCSDQISDPEVRDAQAELVEE